MGNLNYISDIIDENCYKKLEVLFPASGKTAVALFILRKGWVVALFVDITETHSWLTGHSTVMKAFPYYFYQYTRGDRNLWPEWFYDRYQ